MANHPNRSKVNSHVRLPIAPTEAMLDVLLDDDSPYVVRLNKGNRRGEEWEVVLSENDDWRDVVPYRQKTIGRFSTQQEAEAVYYDHVARWRWSELIRAATE